MRMAGLAAGLETQPRGRQHPNPPTTPPRIPSPFSSRLPAPLPLPPTCTQEEGGQSSCKVWVSLFKCSYLYYLLLMLFTIYLSRLAGPCQRWLAGGGRAAAELPCPGHSHGDTDGDGTPRADCVAGTEAGGHKLARQPRLHVLQASPKGKALLLCLPCCHGLLLCSVPRASPVGTNQPLYATSRRSAPAPARSKRRARHSGAGPDPRLRFLPRAASCHSPVTLCRSPTLRDSARHPAGPHSRTPTPSSCAVFLPAPSSSRCLGACVGHGFSGDVPVMVLAAMAR